MKALKQTHFKQISIDVDELYRSGTCSNMLITYPDNDQLFKTTLYLKIQQSHVVYGMQIADTERFLLK